MVVLEANVDAHGAMFYVDGLGFYLEDPAGGGRTNWSIIIPVGSTYSINSTRWIQWFELR